MNSEIETYHLKQTTTDQEICDLLASTIDHQPTEAECKIWHARPVWFLDANSIVGYNKLKDSVQLLFWSGQTFEEEQLQKEGKLRQLNFFTLRQARLT